MKRSLLFSVLMFLSVACFASQTTMVLAAQTQHKVVLNWGASATPGVTYNVFRGTVAGACLTGTKVGTGLTALTFTDSTVVNGATYFYTIDAQNSGGESACTNEVQAVIPSPPSPPGTLAPAIVQ